jgi:biotin operon repressor
MSHTTEILAWLQDKPITPKDALQFGCMRLAARINELREAGYNIHTVRKQVRTRTGKAIVAEYHLIKRAVK